MRIFNITILLTQLVINAQTSNTLIDSLIERGRWGDYYQREASNQYRLISGNNAVDSIVIVGDSALQLSTLRIIFKPLNSLEN